MTTVNVHSDNSKVTVIENAVQIRRSPTEDEIADGVEPNATVVGYLDADGKAIWTGFESAQEPTKPDSRRVNVFGSLTERTIKAALDAKGKGKTGKTLNDGAGLFLRVQSGRRPQWIFRYNSPDSGKRKDMSIGSYPTIGIVAARKLAQTERDKLAR